MALNAIKERRLINNTGGDSTGKGRMEMNISGVGYDYYSPMQAVNVQYFNACYNNLIANNCITSSIYANHLIYYSSSLIRRNMYKSQIMAQSIIPGNGSWYSSFPIANANSMSTDIIPAVIQITENVILTATVKYTLNFVIIN